MTPARRMPAMIGRNGVAYGSSSALSLSQVISKLRDLDLLEREGSVSESWLVFWVKKKDFSLLLFLLLV
jgi:hypothetical protein